MPAANCSISLSTFAALAGADHVLPKRERLFLRRVGFRLEPCRVRVCSLKQTKKINPQHLFGQLAERQVSPGLIPRVNPVHHAEQRKCRDPEIDASSTL